MRSRFVAGIALAILAAPASAQTQANEQSIVNGVRALGATWQRIVANRETFVVQCGSGGFRGERLSPKTTVSVDLRKTDSLMNPYVGYVTLTGVFETNLPRSGCYPNVAAALASQDFFGNDWTYTFALTYQIVDGKLQLSSANQVFLTNGGNDMMAMLPGSNPDWVQVLAMPLR